MSRNPLSPEEAARFRAFERRRHDQLAPTYAGFFAHVTAQAIAPLLAAAGAGPGVRMLDVASGPGALTAAAAALGCAAEGVDLSPGMVTLARSRHPGLPFTEAAAEALPFPDAVFDAVAVNFGIGHFPLPEIAMAELLRVLRPGGRIALSWWEVPARQRVQGLFRDALTAENIPPSSEVPSGHSNLRFSDPVAFRALLEEAGLQRVSVVPVAGEHRLPDVEALWQGGLGSLAVTAAAVSDQSPAVQARLRAVLERLAEPYRTADGLVLPVAFLVASGVKAI